MRSELIVLFIIIINAIVGIIVFFWDLAREKGAYANVHLLVILFCPVVGILFFFFSYLIEAIFNKKLDLEYRDIGFDTTRQVKKVKKGFLEEVDILPLEEAFSVSDRQDRRRALLTALKRDYKKNISSVQLGLNNEDGETSHYAASAILSLTTEFLNKLAKLRLAFDENEDQPQTSRDYLNTLTEFMNAEILDNIDKRKYAKTYVEVVNWMYDNYKEEVLVEDFGYALKLLIEFEDYDYALKLSDIALREYPDEDVIYYLIMKAYYNSENHDKLKELLKRIMDSTINISNETLQVIRFFNYKA